jgi:hypothetical protein
LEKKSDSRIEQESDETDSARHRLHNRKKLHKHNTTFVEICTNITRKHFLLFCLLSRESPVGVWVACSCLSSGVGEGTGDFSETGSGDRSRS